MNKKTTIPAPVGGSSLLVIFAVLCFAVFSMLVLATVKADERLADASYAADFEAERILGQLRAGIVEDGVTQSDNYYSYECPVNDTQQISVVVEVTGKDYVVHRWKLEETVQWEPEEYLDLLDIEDF